MRRAYKGLWRCWVAALLGAAIALPPQSGAQEIAAPVAEVPVAGMRDPELKPYRAMAAGLDAFDAGRALAPDAQLRFRLSHRDAPYGKQDEWDGVTLRLVTDEVSIPVPVARDGTFALPRDQQAYEGNAELVLNRKRATVGFQPEVRSPGLPANVRRLGDLRLQCQVLIAIGKQELNLAQRMFFNTAFGGGDWCASKRAKVAVFLGDWPMTAAVVHQGERRELPVSGYRSFPPIHDKSLPNDALVEFESWSSASEARKRQFISQQPLFLKTSMNKWGKGVPLVAAGANQYRATLQLKAGAWRFKMESDRQQLVLGSPRRESRERLGEVLALAYHGGYIVLEVTQAGLYAFDLDLSEVERPRLVVSATRD